MKKNGCGRDRVQMRWKMTKWLYGWLAGWIGLSIFRNFLVFIHFVCAAVHYYYCYYFLSCFRSAMLILLLIDELTRIVDFSSVLIHNKRRLEKKTNKIPTSASHATNWKIGESTTESWLSMNIAFISGNILPHYQNSLDVIHQALF